MDAALGATTVAPVVTNIAFLRKIMADPRFVGGDYDTLFAEALAKGR